MLYSTVIKLATQWLIQTRWGAEVWYASDWPDLGMVPHLNLAVNVAQGLQATPLSSVRLTRWSVQLVGAQINFARMTS